MYNVKFYRGDYHHRQKEANEDNAVVYLEQHFNSDYKGIGNYATALITYNASKTSRAFAEDYSRLVASTFGVDNKGPIILERNSRGFWNIGRTKMPAVLLEPLFISNLEHVKMILEDGGYIKLGDILVDLIKKYFPDGGLVALSVGHKYKRTKPHDRGAIFKNRPEYTEADVAEWILWRVKYKLEG